MSVKTVLRLYPGTPEQLPLKGLYLGHGLNRRGTRERPFVYASFVMSLDGRIALNDPATGSLVPQSLTSSNDFRLFLELQAQADCLVTHGGYLRAIAERRLDDVLQVGTRDFARDLADWRAANDLPPQPAVVVASTTLRFTLPPSVAQHGQKVIIATGEKVIREPLDDFAAQGYEVITAGAGPSVEGGALLAGLRARGYRSIYLLAGPRMLHTMLEDRALSRLYLTITHQVLGGEMFDTIAIGRPLGGAGTLRLQSLYYDSSSPKGAGQWFAGFEPLVQAD